VKLQRATQLRVAGCDIRRLQLRTGYGLYGGADNNLNEDYKSGAAVGCGIRRGTTKQKSLGGVCLARCAVLNSNSGSTYTSTRTGAQTENKATCGYDGLEELASRAFEAGGTGTKNTVRMHAAGCCTAVLKLASEQLLLYDCCARVGFRV